MDAKTDASLLLSKERRASSRRTTDRAANDLYRALSASPCAPYLERPSEAIILLDNTGHVLFRTPDVAPIAERAGLVCDLRRALVLGDPPSHAGLVDYLNGRSKAGIPLCQMLPSGAQRDGVLMVCARLPKPQTPDPRAVSFLVKLRSLSDMRPAQWKLFTDHYRLTPAEARLCRALEEGMTLAEYSEKWGIAISTARSQLSATLAKTSCKRQIDLLRLIDVFATV